MTIQNATIGIDMSNRNQLYNCRNPGQGDYKKVLCVCSAGLLRSPTAALVLSQAPFNFNTRAAGIEESYALIPVTEVLLYWADEIVCMTKQHQQMIQRKMDEFRMTRRIVVLDIPDDYSYRQRELTQAIFAAYTHCKQEAIEQPLENVYVCPLHQERGCLLCQ